MLSFQLEEEVWLDEEQQELVEELKMEILEERRRQKEHNFDREDEVRATKRQKCPIKRQKGVQESQSKGDMVGRKER